MLAAVIYLGNKLTAYLETKLGNFAHLLFGNNLGRRLKVSQWQNAIHASLCEMDWAISLRFSEPVLNSKLACSLLSENVCLIKKKKKECIKVPVASITHLKQHSGHKIDVSGSAWLVLARVLEN